MVAIIDSGGANIGSVKSALNRLGVESLLTADQDTIAQADHVILPGVGAAGVAMKMLAEQNLIETIRGLRQPVLGICLGLQLLCEGSEEDDVSCLGIFPGRCRRFTGRDLVVPHMGWNELIIEQENPLTAGLNTGDWTYFVHSFYAPVSDCTIATCEYGGTFSAICNRDNFYAAQFHPERSAKTGAVLLQNFITT